MDIQDRLSTPSPRRTTPIRLCDIPAPTRISGARKAAKVWPEDRAELLLAALFPSKTTYWIHGDKEAA